ncbi:UNVERIFIED_CONTAM: hypothetical protein GTU68_029181 [Idotea baltica]|nr:hypothetical protein [Idotea baltica]
MIQNKSGIEQPSFIHETAQLGQDVYVGAFAYIGAGAIIGDGAKIYPHVYVGDQARKDGSLKKIPQTGIVRLEDKVEVGAGTIIDRATLGETVIREGVKLDNLIQVAHNVEIGAHSVIAAQTGISGSTKLGKHCMVGGQVGIVGHLNLADRTQIGAQSGVSKSTKEAGKALRGSPAQDYKQQLRSEAVFRNLDELAKKVHALEQQLLKRDQE